MILLLPPKRQIVVLLVCLSLCSILWNLQLLSLATQSVNSNNYDDAPFYPKQQNSDGTITYSSKYINKKENKTTRDIVLINTDDTNHTDVVLSPSRNSRILNASTTESAPKSTSTTTHKHHQVAGLSCNHFPGGPYNEPSAQEMVYWEDIPTDATYRSPYYRPQGEEQFLTFEPDIGGWNNFRMAMETAMTIAVAMGRTVVLPPSREIWGINTKTRMSETSNTTAPSERKIQQKHHFSFEDFFHVESITREHDEFGGSVKVITMEEFLKTQALTGKIIYKNNPRRIAYPPQHNRTNWNGAKWTEQQVLFDWLRNTTTISLEHWHPDQCIAVFPNVEEEKEHNASTNKSNMSPIWLQELVETEEYKKWLTYEKYIGKPVPVDAPPIDRLKEMWAERKRLCIYTKELQNAPRLHIPFNLDKTRLLTHFYGFLFFEDWKHDLWMKRFIRDHIRYVDEIQCAAARVVYAIRNRVKQRQLLQQRQGQSNTVENYDMEDLSEYTFDTFHIRRGDFIRQFPITQVDAEEMVRISKNKLQPNGTIYVATDEKNKTFFQPFVDANYDVVFLSDFMTEVGYSINSNYYSMIDQLIAARGLVFFGCWYSSVTGYINRLRGYHTSTDHTSQSYTDGIIPSWYYTKDQYDHMQTYYPVKKQFYAREFPTAWRLIDTTIETINGKDTSSVRRTIQ